MTPGNPDRQFWDRRYREAVWPRCSSALLDHWVARLPAGTALDLACGTGRHTIALAALGWRVVGVDISPVGLAVARRNATQQHLAPWLVAADIQHWPITVQFDLVCVFRFLRRELCPAIADALRPGGTLIYETFTIAQRACEGGPRDDAFLLHPGELPRLFAGLDVIEHTEDVVLENDRPRALAALVARKPIAR